MRRKGTIPTLIRSRLSASAPIPPGGRAVSRFEGGCQGCPSPGQDILGRPWRKIRHANLPAPLDAIEGRGISSTNARTRTAPQAHVGASVMDSPASNQDYVEELVNKARAASLRLATLPTLVKDQALLAMAEGLLAKSEEILSANERDLEAFGTRKEQEAMADRLRLTPERIAEMADGIREIVKLPDPVGETIKLWTRPNGMKVGRVRVPIGVIGIIYESRPNVTADSAALCLKSGNACILRGGSEAIHSMSAIAVVLTEADAKAGVPPGAISFVERTDREVALALLKQDQYVDLIIPRGGESLMKTVTEESTIPVIKHDKGICHIYVDADADQAMAERICLNAKVQRPSTCNAMETLLVHQAIARTVLPSRSEEHTSELQSPYDLVCR